jgi:hypothetical protein
LTGSGASHSVPRVRRRLAALAALAALTAPALVACAEDETVRVTVTVRASTITTGPVTTGPVTTGPVTTGPVTTGPGTTTGGASLQLRLPTQTALPGLQRGTPQALPTAADLVGALYASGDPTAPAATQRLQAAGYEQGVIRDQRTVEGGDEGPRLLRIYIFRLRDQDAARAEVTESIAEIKRTTTLPITDVNLDEAAGAGIRIEGQQNADILFVTFSAGRDVYGIQVFAQPGGKVFQPEVVELSGNLYRAWNGVP